jgi:hypothetical protein
MCGTAATAPSGFATELHGANHAPMSPPLTGTMTQLNIGGGGKRKKKSRKKQRLTFQVEEVKVHEQMKRR